MIQPSGFIPWNRSGGYSGNDEEGGVFVAVSYYRSGVTDERNVSRGCLSLLLKTGLGALLGRMSPWVLNHSGIITALKSSCTEIPRCLASVSRRVKVCGPKATITLTDVWVSTQLYPAIPEGSTGDL